MRSMRVVTWNLLHGRSLPDGAADPLVLSRAARTLGSPDVVAVQEVDRKQPRSGDVDQTAVVADSIGAAYWRFAATLLGAPGAPAGRPVTGESQDDGGTGYGIGLVSRWPVSRWQLRRFGPAPVGLPLLVPGSGIVHVEDEPRVALSAVVEHPSGPVLVVATHLSFVPGWNVAQLRALRTELSAQTLPVVLVGDLNLPHAAVRWARGWRAAGPVPTYPAWRPRVQLDHVLVHGKRLTVRRTQARRLDVSDHCALDVDVGL